MIFHRASFVVLFIYFIYLFIVFPYELAFQLTALPLNLVYTI